MIQKPKIEQVTSLLVVPGQLTTPQSIRSVQLYKKGYSGNPPIIKLGSNERLTLLFDELAPVSGQFSIRFTHHNRNWEDSGLPDAWVFDGNNELFLRGGEKNQQTQPEYFHYSFEFPNRNLTFKISGHYLIHVYDYQSGIELFSLPFFVTENEGELLINTETLFNQGNDGAAIDQLFGEFIYPEFIEFPQFDLSYSFVQNRFWKQSKRANQTSFTTEGKTEFHLSRQNSFPANFDFSALNLSELSLSNSKIYNFEPALIPSRVTLKDDVLNFLSNPKTVFDSELGFPKNDRSAQYANVVFRLNTAGRISNSDQFYLIGDFNQWSINDRNRLIYNPDLDRYETKSLIKEGRYSYKYVMLENGKINQLGLTDALTKRDQEYIGFVYYRDPELQFDRLLNTKLVNSFY